MGCAFLLRWRGACIGDEHVVVLHPTAKGDLKRATDHLEADRLAAWWLVRNKGISLQLRALYPELGPRMFPRPPQQRHGAEASIVGWQWRFFLSDGRQFAAHAAVAAASAM